jgi:hypothetical protein
MSNKKLQEYIHYYIGCRCMTPDGEGTLVGLPWHVMCQDRATIHFGKMVKTKNSIDGGHDKVRNHGDYALAAKRYEPIGSEGVTDDGFDMPGGVKLILRQLNSMTEEEAVELVRLVVHEEEFVDVETHTNPYFEDIIVEWGRRSDDDEAENKFNATSERTWSADQFHYLLKCGFDLFNLIDAGLAIDKNKTQDNE